MALRAPPSRMPSLNALRAFEAAARHQSFALAADELGVSPGAVAQQVKSLEAWLGVALFERLTHGVRLTEEAGRALPELSRAFDSLGNAVADLRAAVHTPHLRIAALPSIAQLWLQPRLSALNAQYPNHAISVSALEEPPDFKREPFDLALFFETETREGALAHVLGTDALTPVCSPALLSGSKPLASPCDIVSHTLLHDAMWKADWKRWLDAAGVHSKTDSTGPTFSLYSLAVQAAVDGAGLLIGHLALVKDHLADGRLVAPFDLTVPTGHDLVLMMRERGAGFTAAAYEPDILSTFSSFVETGK